MKRFEKILFAETATVDRMSGATKEAATLARSNDARLTLFGVVSDPPGQPFGLRLRGSSEPIVNFMSDQLRPKLSARARHSTSRTSTSMSGSGHLQLRSSARSFAAATIWSSLPATGQETPPRSFVVYFNSVRHLCGCSDRTSQAKESWPQSIQTTIANSTDSSWSWPDPKPPDYGGELRVVHAWEPYGLSMFLGRDSIPPSPEALAALAIQAEEHHRRALHATLADVGIDSGAHTHLVDGSPLRAITGLLQLYRIDLLVLCRPNRSRASSVRQHGRTGLRRRRLLGARRQFSRLRLAGAVNGGIQATAMNARSCPSRL